jgi:uncharacterized protein with ParB-like and HNH nuclease domain
LYKMVRGFMHNKSVVTTEKVGTTSMQEYDERSIIDDGTGVEVEDAVSEGMLDEEVITDPFNPTQIRVDTRTMTLDLLLTRINLQEIDLVPSFQRKGGIWSAVAQSRLIESIFVRIPLPAFYVDATDDDKWLVVDGLQRLTTLKRFVLDKTLKLTELEFLTAFNGKFFDELPRQYQRRIHETQVTVYVIEKGTPGEVKFNIFKRINTGGLPLSAQEIRHALNQGKATELLIRLANSKEFKRAINDSISDDRMADRECVLRFLAFTLTSYTQYKSKEFDSFLNDAMARMNKMSDQELVALEQQFLRAMVAAFEIFGNDAFRKRYRADAKRSLINKALFESWSVNLNQLTDEQLQILKQRNDDLMEQFITLMNDRAFDGAISLGTGSIAKVGRRFSAIKSLIDEVLA